MAVRAKEGLIRCRKGGSPRVPFVRHLVLSNTRAPNPVSLHLYIDPYEDTYWMVFLYGPLLEDGTLLFSFNPSCYTVHYFDLRILLFNLFIW